ncbi:SIR2 family protein [Solirubrobacter taibaiensis]|nr:SIR2 family protein [Solirubrobacter taibaiensis]
MAHDAETITREFGQKLAARARHVCLFIGAGASRAVGLPDIAGLRKGIVDATGAADRDVIQGYIGQYDVEETLSRLRAIAALTEGGGEIDGIDSDRAKRLDAEISATIIKAVTIPPGTDMAAFVRLASWATRARYHQPVEIFTLNYDLAVEMGFEAVGGLWFDGFVGQLEAPFRDDLVDEVRPDPRVDLPSGVARLWKLHGSVNWRWQTPASGPRRVVRIGGSASGLAAAIYPSYEKYEESRRLPFVALMDRLRRSLALSETVVIVAGYSFSDEHFNELLFSAAERHPRTEVITLAYSSIPDRVLTRAAGTRNILALGQSEAVIGGERAGWTGDEVPGVYEKDKYLLGDFSRLASFLAYQPSADDAP